MKRYIFITILVLLTSTSCYARHPRRYCAPNPRHTTVIFTAPKGRGVHNHLSKCDRMEMAIAYLRSNKTISVKKYAKITGLSKETALAELDAFALDKNVPITVVIDGKKRIYTLIQ